jgi:hypothetical protein
MCVCAEPSVRPAGQPLRHKPAHKPKTYVQQLRELQKPTTVQPRGKQQGTLHTDFSEIGCLLLD